MRTSEFPPLYVYGKLLKLVSPTCYLGCIAANDLSDDEDIKRQYRSVCGRANMLIRKFQRFSEKVRLVLFRAYFTVLQTFTTHLQSVTTIPSGDFYT